MKIYPVLVLFVYALISCTPSITEMVPENKIRISENIFFDNNTKRYVYNYKLPLTKSNIELEESLSINRENTILDSLCLAAEKKGILPIIIYAKTNKLSHRLKSHYDDSTGVDVPIEPGDTSTTFTTCGTLRRNESSEETLNLSIDYQVCFDGFCSPSYSSLIYTLNYKTNHNLEIATDDGRVFILTGETDPGFPQNTYISLDGASCYGQINTVYIGYTNSDSLNDHSIKWKCDYSIYAYIPSDSAN